MEAKKKGRRRSLRILSCITSSADAVSNDLDLEGLTGEAYGTVWLPDKEQSHAIEQQTLESHQCAPISITDNAVSLQIIGSQTLVSEDNVTSEQSLHTPHFLSDCEPQQTFPTPEQPRQCPCQSEEDSFLATPGHLTERNMTGQISQDSDLHPKWSSFCGDKLDCSSKNGDNGPLDYSSPTVDFLFQNTILSKNKVCSVSSTDNEDSGICDIKKALATTLPSPYNMLSGNNPATVPGHIMVSCLDVLPSQTQSETVVSCPDTLSSPKVVSCPDTVSNQKVVSCPDTVSSQKVVSSSCPDIVDSSNFTWNSPVFTAWSSAGFVSRVSCKDSPEHIHRDSCVQQQHQHQCYTDNHVEEHCLIVEDRCGEQEHDKHSSKAQEHHKSSYVDKELSSAFDSQNDASLTDSSAQALSSPDFTLLEKSLVSASRGQTTPKLVFSPSHTDESAETIDNATADRLSNEDENVPVVTNMVKQQCFESDSAQLVKSPVSQSHSSCTALTINLIKSTKKAAQSKRQRRKSAFGAELQLGIHFPQVQDELKHSTDVTDKDSVTSAYKSEECLLQEREADSQTENKMPVSPCIQMETFSTSCMCDKDGRPGQPAACVEESPAGTCSEDRQPVVPDKIRKRRVSAGISVTVGVVSSAEDLQVPEPPDLEPATSAFKRRRSSLRLYRQYAAASSGDQTKSQSFPASGSSTEQNDADSDTDSVVKCVTSTDTASSIKQGDSDRVKCSLSPDSCDLLDESGSAVSHELEQLYRNKNYKVPAGKTWETIFECPSKGKITSKQKLRRFIQFTDHISQSKLKRRVKKAWQNGWDAETNRLTRVDDEQIKQKLQQLDQEMLNSL